MSTWLINSGAGDTFRWENSHEELAPVPENDGAFIPCLPSMTELLRQGHSKLQEQNVEDFERTPTFKTGLGRSIPIKQSSIANFQTRANDSRCDFSNTLFQTGSGKTVNVSSDGLARAKALLGLHEDNNQSHYSQDTQDTTKFRGLNSSHGVLDDASLPRSLYTCSADLDKKRLKTEAMPHMIQSRVYDNTKPPQVKFHTAGGRSISVSSDALRRAKSLLSDLELGSSGDVADASDMDFSFCKADMSSPNTGSDPSRLMCKTFVSPLRSSSKFTRTFETSKSIHSGTNLMSQFDAVSHNNGKLQQQSANNQAVTLNPFVDESLENGTPLRKNLGGRYLGRQLVDISNTKNIGTISTNSNRQLEPEKRRIFGNTVSPFKRPRTSKFSTPMKDNVSLPYNGLSNLSSESSCFKGKVSFPYPEQERVYIGEYFRGPPSEKNALKCKSHQFRLMSPDNAEKFIFADGLAAEAFFHMLAGAGASSKYASKEWVRNHYKWIVWKLACYERCYPTKCAGNVLTVTNVLDELKYRYEREVNRAHRSAIKRILEGDASPTSRMVLCVSAICSNNYTKSEQGDSENHGAKVEVTDGWYSVNALLDEELLKRLASGKLFVGQKLRIWGAGLSGWAGPVSPLEMSSTASLVLHINGTYRTHWGDRLGFCKGVGIPLAFKCIKSNGGRVPLTLVGISRVYPLLYKERLNDGKAIVRSERMESRAIQSYQQRCSAVVEGIVSNFQGDSRTDHDSDSEEGAKILKILENCAEPDVELAGMTPAQISSFAKYQAKMEAIRHSDMEKSIEKALEKSGLTKRDVSPFMRVRVVGLTSKSNRGNENPKEGMVTIWNPSEKQQTELVEGKAYTVAGLLPNITGTDTGITFLQARDFTTWKPLSLQAVQQFKPFFKPRKAAILSKFGEVPLSSEFDIAALVLFVGDVQKTDHQIKQWVFVSDSSISALRSGDLSDCLLAVCFCSPYMDDDSFVPFNANLVGSTVGFNNLVKNPKDEMNHLWVAETSQNSTYFGSFNASDSSHLREAAKSTEQWRKRFHLTIDKLREKVLYIIGQN